MDPTWKHTHNALYTGMDISLYIYIYNVYSLKLLHQKHGWMQTSAYICILAETPPPKTWVDADICIYMYTCWNSSTKNMGGRRHLQSTCYGFRNDVPGRLNDWLMDGWSLILRYSPFSWADSLRFHVVLHEGSFTCYCGNTGVERIPK